MAQLARLYHVYRNARRIFLLYSGMEMSPDPESQKAFILSLYVDDDRILYVQLWFLYLSLHA